MTVDVLEHPLLELRLLSCVFPEGLGGASSPELLQFLDPNTEGPLVIREETKTQIRDLLRWGGFKPSGRSKPASEYLLKAAAGGFLGPINPAVDVCNVVSLHSGLPISVVDLDRVVGGLRIGIADKDTRYVFNASGQEIDVSGLLCLMDENGPCANAVKDSQRTKTDSESRRCLYVFWGSTALSGDVEEAYNWARECLAAEGAEALSSLI